MSVPRGVLPLAYMKCKLIQAKQFHSSVTFHHTVIPYSSHHHLIAVLLTGHIFLVSVSVNLVCVIILT